MRFSALFVIMLLTFLYLAMAQGSYEDCCLRYVKGIKKSTRRMVTSYRVQQMDGGCNISATIFFLKRGRKFCADPRQKWVVDLMSKVDNKRGAKVVKKRLKKWGK